MLRMLKVEESDIFPTLFEDICLGSFSTNDQGLWGNNDLGFLLVVVVVQSHDHEKPLDHFLKALTLEHNIKWTYYR